MEYSVSGTRALRLWTKFTYFLRCGSHVDAGHYFKSSVHGSLRQFSLRRAAFFGALDDEEIFIIEGLMPIHFHRMFP